MKEKKCDGAIGGSFRDPSGFLFNKGGVIFRQINESYKENYDCLMGSGLYTALVNSELLIPHEEMNQEIVSDKGYKIIKPERIPFISYPYEWSFSQLKDAAETTLEIQKISMDYGMSLKDCSAYNIQFRKSKPIFIDTLSFEQYREGKPWVSYRQFCQHFLAPLSLMSRRDIRLNQLFRIYIDGIPLDLAGSLLPFRTYFTFSLLSHIHLHAKSQLHYADKTSTPNEQKISHHSFMALVDSLESAVKKMTLRHQKTEWGDYYECTNYSTDTQEQKKQIVDAFLDKINPQTVWDLGANTGLFSRLASDRGIQTIAFDIDPVAVEKNYLNSKEHNESDILPLLLDLTNPSPGIGWRNEERMSLVERGRADTVFALALIHHLAISNNLPFPRIAQFLSEICKSMIIEFILKEDSQVQKLLSTREDIFPGYTQQDFESEFQNYFSIKETARIKNSHRILYLMETK